MVAADDLTYSCIDDLNQPRSCWICHGLIAASSIRQHSIVAYGTELNGAAAGAAKNDAEGDIHPP
jgi:hypothetical protein